MTDKELRKLNRAALLEMLLEQSRELDRLREQLERMQMQLVDRQLMIDEAGSIAEAALKVNHIFEAAQQAADQYVENVRTLSRRQESVCEKREADSRREAERMLTETREKCRALEAETKEKCDLMTRKAEEDAQEIRRRLEQFIDQQVGLRQMLDQFIGKAE